MEKALFDWPIVTESCCSMTSKRSIGWFLESSRAWSLRNNPPKATRVCIRSINQSNRSISVRLLFLFCSRVFMSRSYENRSNEVSVKRGVTVVFFSSANVLFIATFPTVSRLLSQIPSQGQYHVPFCCSLSCDLLKQLMLSILTKSASSVRGWLDTGLIGPYKTMHVRFMLINSAYYRLVTKHSTTVKWYPIQEKSSDIYTF